VIEAATRAGIKPERFWTMTLREVAAEVRAAAASDSDRLKLAQLTGWFAEVYARTKKLPDAEKILRPTHELTPEERNARQVEQMKRLAMATNAQVVEIRH